MTQTTDLERMLLAAFHGAVAAVGLQTFLQTSLFGSNERAAIKKAA